MSREDDAGWDGYKLGIMVGLGLGFLLISGFFLFAGDRVDSVNINAIGTQICADKGMLYDYRELPMPYKLVIHCKENITKPIQPDRIFAIIYGENGSK